MIEAEDQTKKSNRQFEDLIFPLELEQIAQRQERIEKLNPALKRRLLRPGGAR